MKFTEKTFGFTLKTKVRSGVGIVTELPDFIKEKDFNKIGFVIDGNLYDVLPKLKRVVDNCQKQFDTVIVHLYREKSEPTYQYLDQVKWKFKKDGTSLVDCIVGIGGGSAIDLAKGIATLITNHEPSITYRGFPTNLNPSIPVIAVPSTAGTGTELAYNAVFIDDESKTKLGINTPNNYPVLSILDPEIVSTAPKSAAIGSGVGALIRTLETLVSPRANAVSKMFSKEAFKQIINSFPVVIADPGNLEHWSRMQWGAYYSMAALSNSSGGPAGAISYYLSTQFNVPQGLGYGISGAKFARLNHSHGYYGYAELFDTLNHRPKTNVDDKEKSEFVITSIENVLKRLQVPTNLVSFGMSMENYDAFFEFCTKTAKGALDFNPIKFEENVIGQMLQKMIGGS